MKDMVGDARRLQEQQHDRNVAAADAKEQRKRTFQAAQFKHDQDARDAERRHQEHLVEKHRKEDKLERDTVRAAEKAERDAERASEESKRAFDLKMMEMRIQLAQAEAQKINGN